MHTVSFSAFLLCAIAAASGAIAVSLQRRCDGFTLHDDDASLTFTCGSTPEKIFLDFCIGNDNGQLVPGSNFTNSCAPLDFDGDTAVFTAVCQDNDESAVQSTISLDKFVINGVIVCNAPGV
ncbi:hypothetical protein C8R47DRAFT_1062823 [Mycena vitilis]|nr:hypothetical protein C8R47DRAFT_1062823 [Mycena vitilis]